MEYTHLSEFSLRSGSLTLWRAELAADHVWTADERPLASVHVRHCLGTDATDPRPGRGRWIGTVFEMDAPYDAEHWRETVRLWHVRHEGLRTTLNCRDGAEPQRLVCAPAAVGIIGEPVPAITDAGAITEYLCEALEFELSPLVWPHCLLATVEHADTADFTVLIAADHSVLDAYSQAIVILELRAMYRSVTRGEAVRESPTFGSSADFATLERSTAAALTPECESVELWRRFLGGSGGMLPRFEPAIASAEPHATALPQTSISRKLLSLTELEQIETALTARGHRLSVAVFTALAIAYRRAFGYISMRAIMPISTRPDLQWLESMGWFVNVVPLDITLGPDLDVDTSLESTRTALRRTRVANNATWTRALELLNCDDAPRFGISFLDIRVLPDYELVESLRGHTLRAESYSTDEVFFWVVRGADGLRLSTRFPATFPVAEMDRFLAEFTRAMREFGRDLPPVEEVQPIEDTVPAAPNPTPVIAADLGPACPSATSVALGTTTPTVAGIAAAVTAVAAAADAVAAERDAERDAAAVATSAAVTDSGHEPALVSVPARR
ncbi:condensation domain-containing protein [Nocardia jejuensis]|uniref:condensation domain-containing protein n=1 Tax=Nocardia jejuensis TaxID=328049 RepID=UPI00082E435F|nr:condensation domain-containing protein [Nocardia jejuensis]